MPFNLTQKPPVASGTPRTFLLIDVRSFWKYTLVDQESPTPYSHFQKLRLQNCQSAVPK